MTSREQHPRLPVTPEEIADACIGAAHAGASIVHIHVRDPVSGAPSMSLELYREVVQRLRRSGVDVLINLTTGPGGRFIPSDPQSAAPGSSLTVPGRRVEHVIDLRPDICSLDLNTMISGPSVVINTPKNITLMARSIVAAGTKPELEVFDSGDIHLASDLLKQGALPSNPMFQLVLGVK